MIFKRSECNENMLQHKKFLKDYVADVFETKKTEYFKKRKTKQETGIVSIYIHYKIDDDIYFYLKILQRPHWNF